MSDAICCGLRRATNLMPVAATITYTTSGYTTLRAARERPAAPILGMATRPETARLEGFAQAGDIVVIAAGMPFGVAGTTNLLRIMAA